MVTLAIILTVCNSTNCNTHGTNTYEMCILDPSKTQRCVPNNKYGYLPEGFICVNIPNTPHCKLQCEKACGERMSELTTQAPNGLSSAKRVYNFETKIIF